MAVFFLTPNPRASEASREAYLQASAMRLNRPASAPQLRSKRPGKAVAQAVPVTPLELLRSRSRPTSAWKPKEAVPPSVDPETSALVSPQMSQDHDREAEAAEAAAPAYLEAPKRGSCAEVSQSSLVSTQHPHSETSADELDVPEEDCDDANEAELQGKVEALRRKDLHEKLMKLEKQQKALEEEQQEVQKLLGHRTPTSCSGSRSRPQSAPLGGAAVSAAEASGRRRSGGMAELRIDGKAISGTGSTGSRRTAKSNRPGSSPAIRRPQSAPGAGHRGEAKKSNLRDLHYESMRRQAAQRLELLKQREIQREPWTHGGSRPSRPWSAIPGYTGYRPHLEEDSFVGCNWSRASLQCIRLFGKPTMTL